MTEQASNSADVLVPRWGLSMEDATVVGWLKDVGDQVAEGDPLVELETDKANTDVESQSSGILAEQCAQPGDLVTPGQVLARITSQGDAG